MTRKSLKRVLDQLRTATNGVLRKRTATHAGVQEPQQFEALPVPARLQP